jgi:hypothetical protein
VFGQRGLYGTGTQIPVTSGQQLRDIRIAMIPTGEISGRVLTKEGKPLDKAQVVAMMVQFREGNRRLVGASSSAETNRNGEYRIKGIPPGAYTLRVTPYNPPGANAVWSRDARGDLFRGLLPRSTLFDEEGYPAVYFPGVRDQSLARTVDLRAGGSLTGIDISAEKVRTRRLRGLVIDAATNQPVRLAQILVIRRGAEAGSIPSIILDSSDGRFDEHGVVPEEYYVVATAGDARNPLRGQVAIDMGNADIDNLQITVSRGFNLRGSLSFEGLSNALPLDVSGIRITLKPNAPSRHGLGPAPTLLDPSVSGSLSSLEVGITPTVGIPPLLSYVNGGTLTFPSVSAWTYSVLVDNPLEDVYVKAIRMGNRDVLAGGLTVEGPLQEPLQIVMSTGAGRITGSVLDAQKKPASNTRVVLAPDSPQRRRPELFQALLTGEDGAFDFRNVPPGNYKIFAFEHVNQDSWLDDSFLHLYESQGTPVRVEQSGRVTLELQPLPPWF